MRLFRQLIEMTMKRGADMSNGWLTPLRAFTEGVERLQLRVTMKIHIMKDGHFEDFLTEHAGGVSFAAFSEQSFEHTHPQFTAFCKNFNVPKNFRRLSSAAVLLAVSAWNSTV